MDSIQGMPPIFRDKTKIPPGATLCPYIKKKPNHHQDMQKERKSFYLDADKCEKLFQTCPNQKPTERKLIIQNYTFPGNMRIGQKAKLLIALLKKPKRPIAYGVPLK